MITKNTVCEKKWSEMTHNEKLKNIKDHKKEAENDENKYIRHKCYETFKTWIITPINFKK